MRSRPTKVRAPHVSASHASLAELGLERLDEDRQSGVVPGELDFPELSAVSYAWPSSI
jgi:hypothetical protein